MDDLSVEISEFLEQINYCLSFEFKNKWKHRFSTSFINVFQQKVISSLKRQKPFKLSSLISTYTTKYSYNPEYVGEFFKCIDIRLYSPLIIDDRVVKRKAK